MMQQFPKRTGRRHAALQNFLIERSVEKSAQAVGVSGRTGWRWAKDDRWQEQAREWDKQERLRVAEDAHKVAKRQRSGLIETAERIDQGARVLAAIVANDLKTAARIQLELYQGGRTPTSTEIEDSAHTALIRQAERRLKECLEIVTRSNRVLTALEAPRNEAEKEDAAREGSLESMFEGRTEEQLRRYAETGKWGDE